MPAHDKRTSLSINEAALELGCQRAVMINAIGQGILRLAPSQRGRLQIRRESLERLRSMLSPEA